MPAAPRIVALADGPEHARGTARAVEREPERLLRIGLAHSVRAPPGRVEVGVDPAFVADELVHTLTVGRPLRGARRALV
jgi:hypothetical protein